MNKNALFALCFLIVAMTSFSATSVTATASPKTGSQIVEPTNMPTTREAKWPLLVGKWFGNMSIDGGGKYMWIAERNNDGSYKIQFRTVDPSGRKEDKTEVGEWGVSGNTYFTIYKADLEGNKTVPVDPTNPTNRDAYKILKLTKDVFEYEHLDEGVRFTVRKVPPDFTFPE